MFIYIHAYTIYSLSNVLADDTGVLGVYGIGADLQKISTQLPAVQIIIERMGEN